MCLVAGVLFCAIGVSFAGAATWVWSRPVAVDPGGGGFTGVSCPSIGFCIAIDNTAHVITSDAPRSGTSAWVISELAADSFPFESITCPTQGLCLALDEFGGHVFVSTDPAGGAASWQPAQTGDSYFTGLACPSVGLCVAIDSWGGNGGGTRVLSTLDPADVSTRWKRSLLSGPPCDYGSCAYQLACPSSMLCVAVDSDGALLTSTDPVGGSRAWKSATVGATTIGHPGSVNGVLPAVPVLDISCASLSLCAISDGSGDNLLVSDDPSRGESAWVADSVGFETDWVACPLTTLCVANQGDAFALVSDTPLSGSSSWRWSEVDNAGALTGISCPSTTECVAVDSAGNVVTGSALVAPRRVGGLPQIAGSLRVGSTLTAAIGVWSGSPPVRYDVGWERCDPDCRPIPGAHGTSVRVTGSDLGARLRVRVTAFNTVGSTDAWSAETRRIRGPAGGARP